MKAKFDGRCRDCGGRIYKGEEIRWSRAEGARHAEREDCGSYLEQQAEMRLEAYAEAQLMGYGARAREEGWF